jgi:hypothetical protein
VSDFDAMTPPALRLAGLTPGEGDLDVLRLVAQAFGPGIEALDAADLRELPLDPALDPSKAPDV